MIYWWPTTAGVRLVLAVLLVANRLDVARVFGVFVAHEFWWYHAYRALLWYGHPAVTGGVLTELCSLGLWLLDLGVVGAALLLLMGRLRFFRWRADRGLPWWQPWLYVPGAILANAVAPSAAQ
jgi:hypothetical protein